MNERRFFIRNLGGLKKWPNIKILFCKGQKKRSGHSPKGKEGEFVTINPRCYQTKH
jgi:hypothetical protein